MPPKKKILPKATVKSLLPADKLGVKAADQYTLFLYGPEGIGKSTFAAQADAFFIATEAGLNFVEAYETECPDWPTFVALVDELYKNRTRLREKFGYGAVCVDTIDNAFNFCQDEVCTRRGIEHPADEEWGKGYTLVRNEFTRVLTRLALLPIPLMLLSHERSIEVKGRVLKTNKIVPTLPNSGRRVILPMADIIGHAGFKVDRSGEPTDERIIEFEPTETVECKDRTGLLPRFIPLEYSHFASYLTGDRTKAKKKAKAKPTLRRKRG